MLPDDMKQELAQLADRLRDPFRLRIVVTVCCLSIGYFAIYGPFRTKIAVAEQRLATEQARQQLYHDVEFLRAQVEMFEYRLPEGDDTNAWVQYVIDGIRQYPLKLVNLDSDQVRRVGPYRAVAMRIDLEGSMEDLDRLLYWLETDERLFRIESTKIEPASLDGRRRFMQITLLGLSA